MKKTQLLAALLLAGGLASSTAMAQDQQVKMTTNKAVGSAMTLTVNRTGVVSVDWGDGNVVEYGSVTDPVKTITGTVQGSEITVSGSYLWTLLDCSSCGLTALDVSGATKLQSLYCQNNELTALNLSGLRSLTDLNAAYNSLTSLSCGEAVLPALENINIAGNQLTGNFVNRSSSIQHVNIAGNKYANVYVNSNPSIDALKCGGNPLKGKKLDLSKSQQLSAVNCEGCGLASLTISASEGLPALQQAMVGGNQFTTLDLSASPLLSLLDAHGNQLTSIGLPSGVKLYGYDCSGNNLTFSSLPTAKNMPDHIVYQPQARLNVTGSMEVYNGGAYIDVCPSYAERNDEPYVLDLGEAWYGPGNTKTGTTVTPIAFDADGNETEMTKATASADGDYTYSSGKLAFLKPQYGVYLKLTNKTYPDLVIVSNAFAVGKENANGIEDVVADQRNLQVVPYNGGVSLQAPERTLVTIYDAAGRKVWSGIVSGNVNVGLNKGNYIVNKQKVAL